MAETPLQHTSLLLEPRGLSRLLPLRTGLPTKVNEPQGRKLAAGRLDPVDTRWYREWNFLGLGPNALRLDTRNGPE